MKEGNPNTRRALAAQLEGGARAYGAGAAERLSELANVSGSFTGWLDCFTQRVMELSVAVLLDEPAVLSHGFAWASAGLEARDIEAPDSRTQLEAMRQSLREDLGEQAWSLVDPMLGSVDLDRAPALEAGARLRNDGGYQSQAVRYLELTLEGRWREGISELVDAQRAGASLRELYERVLLPAAAEMGTMWHLGEISVSEEHAATEAILSAMSVLWHEAETSPPNGRRVVVGSVTSDLHSIGVRAAAWLLEQSGCMTACMGSDLPEPDFVHAAVGYDADSVVIGATLATHLPRAMDTIASIRRERPETRVIVGGPAFGIAPGLGARVGADATASGPGETPELVLS